MDISPIQHRLEASDIPTEQLAGNSQLTEEQKIGEATRQFEAMLLRQILSESQKSAMSSSATDNSTAAGIYRDLATNQLAESISKSGAMGLAKTLEREFTKQLHAAPAAGTKSKTAALPGAAAGVDAARPYHCSAKLDRPALKTDASLRRAAAAFAYHHE